ncbi:MAG: hypothetical protein JJE40_12545 [Vicinamibacteria bacterium]|nr:hypothetical protein [Vicinamibacteria bacterium]
MTNADAAGRYVGRNFSSGAAPAIALYLALVAILLWFSLARTGGMFVYAQDDPYIHLALARTLAEHGVWGIRPNEFAFASSSPLWTLLLAALWTLGAHAIWVPFALNIVFGVVFLGVSASYVARCVGQGFSPAHTIAITCALVVVIPLPTLAFIGMEHTLQVLLVVVFAWQAAERLAGQRSDWLWPSVVAALMVGTRYESLFLIAVVGAILLWQGKLPSAIGLGVAAAAPVAAFALYSVAHGGLVLPNSVLMKSGPGRFSTLAAGISAVATDWLAIGSLFARPPQLVLTLGVLIGLLLAPSARVTSASRTGWLAALFLGTSLLHACLVKVEWFFRYEAYLMALGLLAVAGVGSIVEWPVGTERNRKAPWHPATAPLLVLLALPLAIRGLTALATTVPAAESIYGQQVQMGHFFQRFYPGRPVAVNDIGAVAWYSSSPLLDIVGLASQPVADLKRQNALDAVALGTLADEHAVEAIAVYEKPFAAILPASWVKVGEWTVSNSVGVSNGAVAFLARTDGDAQRLRRALDTYAVMLPDGVTWAATPARVRTQ